MEIDTECLPDSKVSALGVSPYRIQPVGVTLLSLSLLYMSTSEHTLKWNSELAIPVLKPFWGSCCSDPHILYVNHPGFMSGFMSSLLAPCSSSCALIGMSQPQRPPFWPLNSLLYLPGTISPNLYLANSYSSFGYSLHIFYCEKTFLKGPQVRTWTPQHDSLSWYAVLLP